MANNPNSPFHRGEQLVQTRLGVREEAEFLGQRLIRDHMPDQHRDFFAALPLMYYGVQGDNEQPWASVFAGSPGFISSPDPYTLVIETRQLLSDPAASALSIGAEIGLLGLDASTRRRNRLNGLITELTDDLIRVQVKQSFGNCPRFIQQRQLKAPSEQIDKAVERHVFRRFDDSVQTFIGNADSFFIASCALDGDAKSSSHGVDVSHRGVTPGSIQLLSDNTLCFPDFSGNRLYNTLGNLLINPKTGLLFLDYDKGDLYQFAGRAELLWHSTELAEASGLKDVTRWVRFKLGYGYRLEGALLLDWQFLTYSPFLARVSS